MSKPQDDHSVKIPPELLEELLTDSEIRMVKQRLLIIRLLQEGQSIRSVAEQVGVGTDTVVRMARKMESNPNLKKLLIIIDLQTPHPNGFLVKLVLKKRSKICFGRGAPTKTG